MTRLQLSKRCGMSVRAILALERGQIEDISIPRFADLALGLGIDVTDLTDKVMEFLSEERGQIVEGRNGRVEDSRRSRWTARTSTSTACSRR